MDKERALAELGIDEEIFDEMIDEYIVQANEKIPQILTAIETGDLTLAGELAHSIKGVAANLRIDDVFEQARFIELTTKEGSTEGVPEAIEKLKELINTMKS